MTNPPVTKSDQIRQLHDEGLTISQIAKKMNTYYSFVHRVVKKYQKDKEANTNHEQTQQQE